MEIEYQLLDSETLDLVNGIMPLMEFYPDTICVKPEFIQSSVEVISKICTSFRELETNLLGLVSDLYRKCAGLGMTISGAGTHPFNERPAVITPLPRYLAIEKRVGYPCHNYITYSIHVHLGMESGDETILAMRLLRSYLPVLLALSASSPFWRGADTKYASYRLIALASAKTYGLPPPFESWRDFCVYFNAAKRAGVYRTFRDYHWDLRPRPDFGTLEIRIMDTQPTVGKAVALAAFSLCLLEYLKSCAEEAPQKLLAALPSWMERENRFRACRWGLDAMIITDEDGNTRPLREITEETIGAIEETANKLGVTAELRRVAKVLSEGPSYMRQRETYRLTGSLRGIVSSVTGELEEELKSFGYGDEAGPPARHFNPAK